MNKGGYMNKVKLLRSTDQSSYFKTHLISVGAGDWCIIEDTGNLVSIKFCDDQCESKKEVYYYMEIDKKSEFWEHFVKCINEVKEVY